MRGRVGGSGGMSGGSIDAKAIDPKNHDRT